LSSKLKVALIQSNLIWENKKANQVKFQELFKEIKKDVDLVVLPEMFTTGFSMNTSLAEKMDGPSVGWMKENANQLNAHLAGSLIINSENKVTNRMIVVSPNGEINFYDKKHLFSMANETDFFDPGEKKQVVEINGFKINLMICYDLRFPVWSRMTMQGDQFDFDCLLYVANWPKRRSNVWSNLLRARAAENMVYVIGVNRVGEDVNGLHYVGGSAVIDPWGTDIIEGKDFTEEIIYAELEKEVLDHAREKFPVARDADEFTLN